jgi:hypothetical protein
MSFLIIRRRQDKEFQRIRELQQVEEPVCFSHPFLYRESWERKRMATHIVGS